MARRRAGFPSPPVSRAESADSLIAALVADSLPAAICDFYYNRPSIETSCSLAVDADATRLRRDFSSRRVSAPRCPALRLRTVGSGICYRREDVIQGSEISGLSLLEALNR